jgi:starch synthase
LTQDCQLVVLGSGFPHYEQALKNIAAQHPTKVAVTLGYNESFAHRIEASSDIFLMPSIFEPCGLNQMYSLRYGTLPIVHAVGGLRDTVFEETQVGIPGRANGFVFSGATADELFSAIQRAIELFQYKDQWKELQLNAMSKDFSWDVSAKDYLAIYEKIAINENSLF